VVAVVAAAVVAAVAGNPVAPIARSQIINKKLRQLALAEFFIS